MGTDKEQKAIDAVIGKFPAEFRLRNHEGLFRISRQASYFRGPGECAGELMLYTQRWRAPLCEFHYGSETCPCAASKGEWVDFAKGTEYELMRNIVA